VVCDPKAIGQRQAGMKKQDIDPANIQIPPMKDEGVDAIPLVDTMYAGTPRREYYRKSLGQPL
jgi:hypothetical protein